LLAELKRHTFTAADEICPSLGDWISAQTLLNRDSDEFTQTSTRNTAVTRNTGITSGIRADLPHPTQDYLVSPEDLTPGPEHLTRPSAEPPMRRVPRRPGSPAVRQRLAPLVVGMAAVTGLWILVNQLKPRTPVQVVESVP